jgi:hypothetical protein
MLINGENIFLKKSIRQKKAPKWKDNFESYAVNLEEIFERLNTNELFEKNNIDKLRKELRIEESYNFELLDIDMYVDILGKIILDKNAYHISKVLSNKELFFIIVFTVVFVRMGFRFIDIEYLTLKAIGAKKASNWVDKYYGSTVNLHKNLIVGIYAEIPPKEPTESATITLVNINKVPLTIEKENDIITLIENILKLKIVFFLDQSKKIDIKPIYFNEIKNISFVNKKK